MGTNDLHDTYIHTSTRATGLSESAYISGKSQVPIIYLTWVTHLQAWKTVGMLRE